MASYSQMPPCIVVWLGAYNTLRWHGLILLLLSTRFLSSFRHLAYTIYRPSNEYSGTSKALYPWAFCLNLLLAYFDADWAGDPDTQWSITRTCVFFGPNHLSWTTKKQPIVARSSAKLEYCVLASTTIDIRWFCFLLHKLGVSLSQPPLLLSDNMSALSLAHNPGRSRHIEIAFIRELLTRGAIKAHYIPTSMQLADFFRKGLSKEHF